MFYILSKIILFTYIDSITQCKPYQYVIPYLIDKIGSIWLFYQNQLFTLSAKDKTFDKIFEYLNEFMKKLAEKDIQLLM
jgi:hypothetical protein